MLHEFQPPSAKPGGLFFAQVWSDSIDRKIDATDDAITLLQYSHATLGTLDGRCDGNGPPTSRVLNEGLQRLLHPRSDS